MEISETRNALEPGPWVVVLNPTKVEDRTAAERSVAETAEAAGWPAPTWIETTEDDPGTGQARQALDDGVTLIASYGGDGTVRAVAAGLVDAGSDTPQVLLPAGTGNLLARNLDLPIDSLADAVTAGLTGTPRRIDTGVARYGDHTGWQVEELFLVMAGVGLDADTMHDTNEKLKTKVGWPAYILGGAKSLVKPGISVCVTSPDEPDIIQRVKSVVVGNCGMLTGGIELMPDAILDDGLLDVVVVSPSGPAGWIPVVSSVLTKSRHGHGKLIRRVTAEVEIRISHPTAGEVDGDPLGTFTRMKVGLRHASLTVMAPPADPETGSR